MPDLSILIVPAVIAAFVVWGVWPKSHSTPAAAKPPAQPPASDGTVERKVGVVTGLMGGTIKDAAIANYALSRLDHPATDYEIGVAAGIQKAVSESDQPRE